jgi:predicted AlkP superfamily phosphohydrolase/phosphomutase
MLAMDKKLLVIGLDGASFNVLDELIAKGHMPSLADLIRAGSRADLETTFPPITAVAWSSFMTGKNPGKHGIFEFVMRDGSKRELAANASLRRGRAVWELLSDAGWRVIVHNFPCTYPPSQINGLMIADFMTPRGRRDFTHPRSLLTEIEDKFGPYRLHLFQTYAGGNVEGVLEELFDELDYKIKVAEYLMTRYGWDAFFQYFWGTDRIQHELWHIIDASHPRHDPQEAKLYYSRVCEYFQRIDEAIGRLIALAGEDAITFLASDHGFGPAHKYCSFNLWLLQEGFLKLKSDALTRIKRSLFLLGFTPENIFKAARKVPLRRLRPWRGLSNQPAATKLLSSLFLSFNDVDWSRTVAFSKGNYGQIYINLKGREPFGIVEESEYESVCEKLIERLRALEDPLNGGPWVASVFRRNEIYSGPCIVDAPDIAFLPRDMRYLPLGNADFTSNRFITEAFGISGCHRMHGVLIACGGPIKHGFRASAAHIVDVAPTMLYLLEEKVPDDMDGQVISEIISDDYLKEHPIQTVSRGDAGGINKSEFSDQENAEVIERLRNLGYVG